MRIFINEDYETCPTYPSINVIPEEINDQMMINATKFRTKRRFPSLTFFDKNTGCSIWRSSQTMVSIFSVLISFIDWFSDEQELR
jgi:myotubularin-related protein 6/7/8